jgi:predicted dehydrogenase
VHDVDKVRFGIIGIGNIGTLHAHYMPELKRAEWTAAADIDPKALDRAKELSNGKVECFDTAEAMMDSGSVDAVIIATPHYDHPPLSMAAFERGLHVLVEKPVAVTARAAEEVNDAYDALSEKPVYAAMFQQRMNPVFRRVKTMIDNGELGEIKRVSWLITSWYRSQAYYDSGGWRATWAGEGGGVLINQCPHNLDMIQWLCGMPNRVTANVGLGKHHDIEVDDDVTALLEYPNGATGVFVTTTADSPGTNRLEITGDLGKIVIEPHHVEWTRTHQPVSEHLRTTTNAFGNIDRDVMELTVNAGGGGHKEVTEHFVAAVLDGAEPIAHATEGIRGLELGNAMLMSGLRGQPIDIPTPREEFEQMIRGLAEQSTGKKQSARGVNVDVGASF